MARSPATPRFSLPELTGNPWGSTGALVFRQVVAAALRVRGVWQAELSLETTLLGALEVRKRQLVVVAGRGRSAAWRAELAPLGSVRPLRRRASSGPLAFAKGNAAVQRHAVRLRLQGEAIGELRIWHAGLPAQELALLGQAAGALLHTDELRQRLQRVSDRARALLESAPEPALIVDGRSGRAVAFNRHLLSLARRRPADWQDGFDLHELFDLPERPSPLSLLRGRARGARLVWTLSPRGQEPIPVAVSASRLPGRRGSAVQWHLQLRDISEEEAARRDLIRAKETLAAIAVAGAQLQAETERPAIFESIGRELSGLGYHAAILFPAPASEPVGETTGADLSWPPLWSAAHVSAPPGHSLPPELVERELDPNQIPALQRALSERRPIFSWVQSGSRVPVAIGGTGKRSLSSGQHRPAGTIWAPLIAQGAVFGALQVSGRTLSPEDSEGIAAFALQVSMALERARLYGALKRRSQDLESEVERRTRELTLAVRALREIDRRKDNFMANVSHELRTPLVTILGYTQLVLSGRMGPLSEAARKGLETSRRNGEKLKDFIDELMDYSRHELTQEPLRRLAFPIRRAIEQAAAGIYPKLLDRGLLLRTRVANGTPDVYADPERLVQVLANLLGNAERHCVPGGHLHIAAALVGTKVRVAVADDGTGIPLESRERVFERLYQVGDRAVARDKGAGLGLGLAIAKAIVEAHGGRIWLDQRLRRGTRFLIELPRGDAV